MKKIYLAFVFVLCGFVLSYAEVISQSDNQESKYIFPFRLELRSIPGAIIGGSLNNIKNTLSPIPDSTPLYYWGVSGDAYFTDLFGITAGYDFSGTMSTDKTNVKVLNIANMSKINLGLTCKIPLLKAGHYAQNSSIVTLVDLVISAGGNYNFFDLTSDYKALYKNFENISFYKGPAVGIGFWGGFGVDIIMSSLLIGVRMNIVDSNYKYADAQTGISMIAIEVPIYVGFAF